MRLANTLTPDKIRQMTAGSVFDARQMVFRAARRGRSFAQISRSPLSRWLGSKDPQVVAHGIERWVRQTKGEATTLASEWLKSVAEVQFSGIRDVVAGGARATTAARGIDNLTEERLLEVYLEVFERGDLAGGATRGAFDLAGLRIDQSEKMGTTSLMTFVIRSLGMAQLAESFDRLLDAGAVVRSVGANDPRVHALTSTLQGTHRVQETLPGGLTRWRHKFSESHQSWAYGQLRRWGLQPDSGQVLAIAKAGGREVIVPAPMAREIERLTRLNIVDSRKVFGSSGPGEALNLALRMWNQTTTHGIFVPAAAHIVGQMVGVIPTLWTTRGAVGLASSGWTIMRHPATVGGLMKRLSGHPLFEAPGPAGQIIKARTGEIYSIDELEKAAREAGLQDTLFKVESAESVADLISRADDDILSMQKLRMGRAWWTDLIQELAGAFDQLARVSTYLDEVVSGKTPQAAATVAREAALDYRALGAWEQQNLRKIFAFYSFLRKNADAYTKALFRDPGRVTQQMRLAHASIVSQGLSDLELSSLSDDEVSRLVLFSDDEVVNDEGRIHPWYRLNRIGSTPLGPGEYLGIMRMLTSPREMAKAVNPFVDTMGVLFLGQRLGADWKPDAFNANRIPPVLLNGFWAPFAEEAFGVGPVDLRPGIDLHPGLRAGPH